ncbi:MAG: HAMP domain-containing histidine kinase [Bacteroidales bacterium]|nr:HAMP domain-containing histidine kinase [Bacteroidales bacterium]
MRKSIIWILITLMVITFGALIALQVRYLSETAIMAANQFDDGVKRSLIQTVTLLEENEALKYLAQTLEENQYVQKEDNSLYGSNSRKDLKLQDSIKTRWNDSSGKTPDIKLSTGHGKATIEETSKFLREKFELNFSRSKTILDQAVFRWLRETENTEISRRINFNELDEILTTYFESNNINLPFYYSVVDRQNKIIYQCNKTINVKKGEPNTDVYSQKLFPREESQREAYLQVVFPTKKNFIFDSLNLLLPSIGVILLTLAIFIITIVVIFRQKQLSTIKNDFINNMTHEFKTPISTISLASQMLQDQSVGMNPKMLQQASNVIKDETKRLSLQVEKVLQMSMFENEKTTLKPSETHLNNLIKDIISSFSLKVTSKGGEIVTNLKATRDLVMIDEIHFTNVIFNLMDNGLKYCDKTPILTLETWNEKENVCVSIEDNGIGMKKDDLKKIFEKFYRVSTGNLHDVKGFGLGLAYVKKIVNDHEGTIKVESEIGLGTKFTIIIPTIKNY